MIKFHFYKALPFLFCCIFLGWLLPYGLSNFYILNNQLLVVLLLALPALTLSSQAFVNLISSDTWGIRTALASFFCTSCIGIVFIFELIELLQNHDFVKGGWRVMLVRFALDFLQWSREATESPYFITRLVGSTFGVGFLEEMTKSLPAIYLLFFSQKKSPAGRIVAVGYFSGLGFGVAEALYNYNPWAGSTELGANITRWFACVPSHGVYSAIDAVFLLYFAPRINIYIKTNKSVEATCYIVLSLMMISLLHGFYNTMCYYSFIGIVLDAIAILVLIYAAEIVVERESSSISPDISRGPSSFLKPVLLTAVGVSSIGLSSVLSTHISSKNTDIVGVESNNPNQDYVSNQCNDYIEWATSKARSWAEEIIQRKEMGVKICVDHPAVIDFCSIWGLDDKLVNDALSIYQSEAQRAIDWRTMTRNINSLNADKSLSYDAEANEIVDSIGIEKRNKLRNYHEKLSYEAAKRLDDEMSRRRILLVAYYQDLWSSGDSLGLLKQGLSLIKGRILSSPIEQNVLLGLSLIERASAAGNAEASYQMGKIYEGDYDNRNFYLGDSVDIGQENLKRQELELPKKDTLKARSFYEKSILQGNIGASVDLFFTYQKDENVPLEMGLEHLIAAVKMQNPRAKLVFDELVEGRDVYFEKYYESETKSKRGTGLTAFPVERGLLRAAGLYSKGLFVVQDESRSLERLKRAAELESKEAEYLVGVYQLLGKGCVADAVSARAILEKYEPHNYPPLLVLLGSLYHRGIGGYRSTMRAMELYKKAYKLNDPYAAICIGLMHEYGDYVPQSKSEAREMYKFAKNRGVIMAMDYLERLDER